VLIYCFETASVN